MESEFNCSIPKLSLSKYPKTNKFQRDNNTIVVVTPPIRTLAASIPFQWEEAPGKPRNTNSLTNSTTKKSRAVRCLELDLPPSRLRIDSTPSVGNVASPTTVLEGPYIGRTMSSEKMFSSFNDSCSSGKKKRSSLGSSLRWGSFKEVMTHNTLMRNGSKVNITRMTRRSFIGHFSRTSSNLLGGLYESLKQVIQWGHGQEKNNQ
ncbi:hypothetical protein Leryth_026567 [Lithospermum erythrorhizon]|nr:hypothetical protein Leryth_026567 [Lithospermum erythrorhizon]